MQDIHGSFSVLQGRTADTQIDLESGPCSTLILRRAALRLRGPRRRTGVAFLYRIADSSGQRRGVP
jgi:hypothetical protein